MEVYCNNILGVSLLRKKYKEPKLAFGDIAAGIVNRSEEGRALMFAPYRSLLLSVNWRVV